MKNKSIPVETIRSFFGEHQRRISFQAPVSISFQEKLKKEINLFSSTKEQVRKILQCLLESNFPHNNLDEALNQIEAILDNKIGQTVKECEDYIAEQEDNFNTLYKNKYKYKNDWDNENLEYKEEKFIHCNGRQYLKFFNPATGTYGYSEVYQNWNFLYQLTKTVLY